MLKEKFEILKYNEELCSVSELAEMHRAISKATNVSKYLIYSDDAFIPFLSSHIINSNTDNIFLILNSVEKTIGGFCRIKDLSDTLFLNNIYLKPSFQGQGLGKELLFNAIQNSLNSATHQFFSLDVFQSNSKATQWYKSLSMDIAESTNWYKITNYNTAIKNLDSIYNQRNKMGFIDLMYSQKKIGSLVNNTPILNSFDFVDILLANGHHDLIVKTHDSVPEFIKKHISASCDLLQISFRMKGLLRKVLDGLKNK
jgi:ribosomal protein S18 acetylase RimI-like enzyme